MNKQLKPNGNRGIEWTDYTWNPIGGCKHACRWQMPDGKIAECYAENVAEKLAGHAYPHGFAHHYWNPKQLTAPASVKEPSRVFVGSMADVFGHWVPSEQIERVLDVCRNNPQHTFQFLTKNPKRLKEFTFPDNCWTGVSTPPDFMWGKPLNAEQKTRLLEVTMDELWSRASPQIAWLSAEPLSHDVVPVLKWYRNIIRWIVIGAASNGKQYFQPNADYLHGLLNWCNENGVAVFFKGNLRPSYERGVVTTWREEFPNMAIPTHPRSD